MIERVLLLRRSLLAAMHKLYFRSDTRLEFQSKRESFFILFFREGGEGGEGEGIGEGEDETGLERIPEK